MRYFILFVISFAISFLVSDVFAQSPEAETLKSKVETLEKELKEIKDLLKQQSEKDVQKEKEIASLKEEVQKKEVKISSEETSAQIQTVKEAVVKEDVGEVPYLAKKGSELAEKKLAPSFGGIYTKPFLRRFGRNTCVGGCRSGEVILEFGTIDFLLTDWINWRGGFLLTPLGKLNLVHDSPLQDFTDRPLVDQLIIPTTLTDLGMGFFGTMYPSELSKLDYEIYVTNGVFRGLDANGEARIGEVNGLRSAKGGYFNDSYNESPGVVGRVAFSPFIGLEVAGSAYTSQYDENNDNQLTISALDFTYQRGPFEFLGEGAYAFMDTNELAEDAGITDDMWGYYLEARYHFMPSVLKNWSPKIFTENSTFTGVLRWDQVQTAGRDDDFESVHWLRNRVTPGLNYRYTEDTVFKLDYQINMEEKDMPGIANNAFLFSVATYF